MSILPIFPLVLWLSQRAGPCKRSFSKLPLGDTLFMDGLCAAHLQDWCGISQKYSMPLWKQDVCWTRKSLWRVGFTRVVINVIKLTWSNYKILKFRPSIIKDSDIAHTLLIDIWQILGKHPQKCYTWPLSQNESLCELFKLLQNHTTVVCTVVKTQ